MLNHPPFFASFAASIRHEDLGPDRSSVTYRFNFTARPRLFRFVLHPIMGWVFRAETRKRLAALKTFFTTPAAKLTS